MAPDREAALTDRHEVENELFEIIAMVLGEAVSDGDDKGGLVMNLSI